MMKLTPIAPNQTETLSAAGTIKFYSYSTPVAAMLPSGRYVRSKTKYSVTTTKHVNKWLKAINNVELVDQEFIDNL